MSNDNVIHLIQPGIFDDQLTEVLRNGARALLAQAVEAEVADFLGQHADLKTRDGHQRVVRHGHLPEREVMTGIGPVAVRQPRVRDREADAADPGRIRFSPSILPPYMRRSKSIETLLPILYAYFGLSPIDGGPCTLADIKNLIEAVSTAVTPSKPEGTQTAEIDRTLLAAKARFGLDEGTGLLPDELAALVRLGQKSMRNALTPSSGSGLEVKDGRITATSALTWLNARGDFKSSIWHQSSADVFSPSNTEPALDGELLWVPFASDQTEFDPAKCQRNGKYTLGPKGSETTFTDYRRALDTLARMKPTAYWRRPNSAGNWGIVTAAGFRPRSAQELGLAASEGATR